jgi:hypothetical protein
MSDSDYSAFDAEKLRTLDRNLDMTLAEVRQLCCPLCAGRMTYHYIPGDRDSLLMSCEVCGVAIRKYRLVHPPLWAAKALRVTTVDRWADAAIGQVEISQKEISRRSCLEASDPDRDS